MPHSVQHPACTGRLQALADAARAAPLNKQAINRLEAAHAYNWTTATNAYPYARTPALVGRGRSVRS
jgi:hypothetical protein